MRRIFVKEGNYGSFRFRKKSSELSATPVGEPRLVTLNLDRKQVLQELKRCSPYSADAFMLGQTVYVEPEYQTRVTVQYYKIQVVYMP